MTPGKLLIEPPRLIYKPTTLEFKLITSFQFEQPIDIAQSIVSRIDTFCKSHCKTSEIRLIQSLGEIHLHQGQGFTQDVYELGKVVKYDSYNITTPFLQIFISYFPKITTFQNVFMYDNIKSKETFTEKLEFIKKFHNECYQIPIDEITNLKASLQQVEQVLQDKNEKQWVPRVVKNQ